MAYEAGVIAAGLEAEWDNRLNAGPAGPPNKTLGVDTLPSGATWNGSFLNFTGDCVLGSETERWDLSAGTFSPQAIADGTTIVINHAYFAPGAYPDPSVPSLRTYGFQIGDISAEPVVNVTLNNCKFDGQKYNSDLDVAGPWNGSAVFVLTGCSLTLNNTIITGCGYDAIKATNCTLVARNLYVQAIGWNQNADADGIQAISVVYDLDGFVFDYSDFVNPMEGGFNNVIFNTIDTPSLQNSSGTIKNGIFKGNGAIESQYGGPFNTISVADNHTPGGLASGFIVDGVLWQSLAIEKGNTGSGAPSHLGYATSFYSLPLSGAVGAWSGVYDLQSGVAINNPAGAASTSSGTFGGLDRNSPAMPERKRNKTKPPVVAVKTVTEKPPPRDNAREREIARVIVALADLDEAIH